LRAEVVPPQQVRRHPFKRQLAHWSRVLHTYLSMVSFSILLFFAATGLTLNHQDKLTGEPKSTRLTGKVELSWVGSQVGENVNRTQVVEALRAAHGIKAANSDFRVDDDQVSVSFKGPGYAADAFIDRKTGAYELNESRLGFVAIINDLHKGRDTGSAWSGIIDISAGFMVLVSLTGLVLIFFLQKRLATGLISLGIGTAVCASVYLWLVS
jgi:hypothetical protein